MTNEELNKILPYAIEARRSIGNISQLLYAINKQSAIKASKEIIITLDEFQSLISNHQLLGFEYDKQVFTHMPLEKPKRSDVIKDIHYLEQRKITIYHQFYNSSA